MHNITADEHYCVCALFFFKPPCACESMCVCDSKHMLPSQQNWQGSLGRRDVPRGSMVARRHIRHTPTRMRVIGRYCMDPEVTCVLSCHAISVSFALSTGMVRRKTNDNLRHKCEHIRSISFPVAITIMCVPSRTCSDVKSKAGKLTLTSVDSLCS